MRDVGEVPSHAHGVRCTAEVFGATAAAGALTFWVLGIADGARFHHDYPGATYDNPLWVVCSAVLGVPGFIFLGVGLLFERRTLMRVLGAICLLIGLSPLVVTAIVSLS